MANISLSERNKIASEIASARQTLSLLQSELKSGNIDRAYWLARFDDLNELLDTLAIHQQSSNQQQRLIALYEVSRVLGSSLDPNEVLDQVMDAIIKLTDAERGYLMLLNEKGELEVKAARNIDKETLGKTDFAISESVIRVVAETGKQVVTTNATEDPRFSTQGSVVTHNLRSIQCAPLLARGNLIGVIYVDNRFRTGVFDENDLEMLMAFASQAAAAIENARLFTMTDEALAKKVDELSMMQKIDHELNQTLDFDKVMKLTLDWAVRVTEADNGGISFIDLDTGDVRMLAEHGDSLDDVEKIMSGDLMMKTNVHMSVPIQREGKVIGLITLNRDEGKKFASDSHSFVQRLAEHAAIAIENAGLYEAVKAANNAKSEFVSVVTHELRIPMTSIKGYADMIGMGGPVTDQQKNFIDIIKSNVARMGILVSDLSDVSRIETGRLNLEVEENVSILEVLESVLPSMQTEIDEREHTVNLEFPANLPGAKVDPRRLSQVFINLVSNAYKYTPNGGTITIKAEKVGKFVRCAVIDSGVGMSPKELDQLFTKFWRSDDAHVREQHGTGLGLTIIKSLIELHGGELIVESEKDKGTSFAFTLPIG